MGAFMTILALAFVVTNATFSTQTLINGSDVQYKVLKGHSDFQDLTFEFSMAIGLTNYNFDDLGDISDYGQLYFKDIQKGIDLPQRQASFLDFLEFDLDGVGQSLQCQTDFPVPKFELRKKQKEHPLTGELIFVPVTKFSKNNHIDTQQICKTLRNTQVSDSSWFSQQSQDYTTNRPAHRVSFEPCNPRKRSTCKSKEAIKEFLKDKYVLVHSNRVILEDEGFGVQMKTNDQQGVFYFESVIDRFPFQVGADVMYELQQTVYQL